MGAPAGGSAQAPVGDEDFGAKRFLPPVL
jgi:hypothetical protein